MTEITSSTTAPPRTSSWLRRAILLLFVILLFLLNYPGNHMRGEHGNYWLDTMARYRVEHGWPWNYRTEVQWVPVHDRWKSDAPFDWSEFQLWNWSIQDSEIHWLELGGNLLVATVILAICYWFTAKDRLQLAMLLRGKFSLLHLFLLVTVVAILTVGWKSWRTRCEWNARLNEELWDKHATRPRFAPDFPAWIRQAVGEERLLKLGWNVPHARVIDLHPGYDEKFIPDDIRVQFIDAYPENIRLRMESHWHEYFRYFPRAQSVSGISISDEELNSLEQTPDLRTLDLDGMREDRASSFTGKNASKLQVLQELNHVSLPTYTPISADAIHELAKLPKLHSLRVRYWDLDTEARLALGELTQLQLLYIDANGMKSGDLKPIGKLTKLEALELRYADIDDQDLADLANCKQLRWLEVLDSRVGNLGLKPLLNHPRLMHLMIYESKITDDVLPVLESLSELRVLDCRYGGLRHLENVRLEKLPKLRYFSFSTNFIAYRTIATLDQKFPHLKMLHYHTSGLFGHTKSIVERDFPNCYDERDPQAMNLASYDINDEALRLFAKEVTAGRLPFTKLWLTGADLTDASIDVLNQFQHVEVLHLFHTPITAAGIARLQGFPQLTEIILDPAQISPAAVATLKQFPALKKVHLNCGKDRCPERDAALKQFKNELPMLQ